MAGKKLLQDDCETDAAEASPHKVLHRDLIPNAKPGNRAGLAMAFAQAAGWLRAGEAPPPELSAWIAEKLQGLANVLHNPRVKGDLPDQAARALGIVEKGKRGRKADTERELALKRLLIRECYYQRRQHPELTWEQVFERVAMAPAAAGVHVSVSKIEAAWKHRRTLAPEIPELNP